MWNRSNYVVVITSLLSSAFRLLLVWPGVVLAIFGFIFFIATLCDNGAQKAASRMAGTAQEYRAAPAGMVMVRLCPHADDPVWEVAPVLERDCKPHPKTFTDVARQERRVVLWIGSVLIVLGMLVELFYLLYRRRQMALNAVYGSINARGEYRAVTYLGEANADERRRSSEGELS
ncbi:hypothetical protein IM282_15750 [Enterobacter cloacae complex sp. P29RS]|uniref:hypothetical protein n=1 Tax=Enterobacter cloacae complex sp. P29RS TaxID=2779563 RepID=UPI001865A394|nr:hypothetical protein [Enterobacter cloacae complex sp. P29RS]MBE3175432.1 hypothetical protein [Enterobacter cloacae complex sp. P29RS]